MNIELAEPFRTAIIAAQQTSSLSLPDMTALRAGLNRVLTDKDYFDALRRFWDQALTRPLPDRPPLTDDQLRAVLINGLDALDEHTIVELAINPHLLMALRDEIIEIFPPYWESLAISLLPEAMAATGYNLKTTAELVAFVFKAAVSRQAVASGD